MKQRCAVLGIGQTHHAAKRGDLSMSGLVREAALRALEDAGMTFDEIDAVVMGKAPDFFEGVMTPELYLADALGAAGKPGLYEPIHGSAPDIAGQGVANPLAAILSFEMALRWSLGRAQAADVLLAAVKAALDAGARTRDLGGSLSTVEMGDAVLKAL
jgi:hypothetical protein